MATLREQAKAVVSGVLAGLGSLATAMADQQVTQLEWVLVGIAAVGAYGLVYGVGQPATQDRLFDQAVAQLTSDRVRAILDRVLDREAQERAR